LEAAGAEAAGVDAGAEAAGVEAGAEAAGAAVASAAGAGAGAGVGAGAAAGAGAAGAVVSSAFLEQATRAIANREAINNVFFMNFPSNIIKSFAMNNYR